MKKKLLVAAIATALAAAATVDQAESLLFPYFKSGGGAWSFVELVVTGGVSVNQEIHYLWASDLLDTPELECEHGDQSGVMTKMDLGQHTVAAPFVSGMNLPSDFGDTTSTPGYNLSAPARGFMIVTNRELDDADGDGTPHEDSGEGTMSGSMVVVDTNTGLVTAYRALNNPGQFTYANKGNWNNIFTSHPTYDLTWYPAAVVSTIWYTLVTGVNMDDPAGWAGAGIMFNGFANVFNRNEVPYSGNIDRGIVCHAFFTRSDLMTGAQVAHSDMGGYMWSVFAVQRNSLSTNPATPTDASGILMTKFMTTPELGGVATTQAENAWPNLPY